MRGYFSVLLAGAGLLGHASIQAAHAADPGATSSQQVAQTNGLEEIVVTAQRREQLLQDVPISMTVINQQQLDNRNIVMGSDLAVYTPSLTVNQRYGAETSSFAIRGFLQEANTAPSVGVYFADVVTPLSFGSTVFGSNLPIGAFMDLQNTQILKGPQGTLFGRNTTGGAILLQPVRPNDEFGGYVEGSVGNYGMWRTQAVLNVPVSDKLNIRLGIDHMQRDGYIENESGIGPSAYDDVDYTYLRLGVLAELTDDLENYTVVHYSTSSTNGFASRIADCATDPLSRLSLGAAIFTAPSACAELARARARGDGPLTTDINLANPFSNIKEGQAINTTTWDAGRDLTVKNIVSYSQYIADQNFSLSGENFTTMPTGFGLSIPLELGVPFSSTIVGPAPGYHGADQWEVTEELQFQGKALDERLTWQAGAYFEFSRSPSWNATWATIFLSCTNPQALQCSNPYTFGYLSNHMTETRYDDEAGYAQATYKVTDNLNLTAGFRYTWDNEVQDTQNTQYNFPFFGGTPSQSCTDTYRLHNADGTPLIVTSPAQCAEAFTAKSSKPTWVIDADYKPIEDLMLYAKYARGYRAGGIASGNVGAEVWQPEKLDTYEIGVKGTLRGAVRGYFDVAGFYNDFTNQQLVSTTINKTTHVAAGNAIVNAGQSTIKGIEVDSSVYLLEHFNLTLGYTYLDTRIDQLTAPSSPLYIITLLAKTGDPLPQVPKNRVTATLTYSVPMDEKYGDLDIGTTFTHTDKQLFNENSSPAYVYLPATNLLNVNVNWTNVMQKPLDLSFFMTNATDELNPVVNGGEYMSLGYDSVQYGQPRMWGFRLRYHFGGY